MWKVGFNKEGGNKMKEKNKKVKTTEMLDYLAKKVDYSNTPECEKRTKYQEEIGAREPFSDIKSKINRMETKIQSIEKAVVKLLKHKHDKNEKVVINIEDSGRIYL